MTLSHDVTGSGPVVLLLHSTVCDRRMWDPQVPALAGAGFRVVRCDLPGYGESPVPAEPYDTAAEVLALAGAETFALVGASGGGEVALGIAARWPHRVTALALLATAVADLEPGPELRERWQAEEALVEAGDIDAAAELNVRCWLGPAADAATRAKVYEMQRHALRVQFAATGGPEEIEVPYAAADITARSLLVSGAHDLPDFRRIAADLAGRLPEGRHVELAWAGHLPSLERPEEINQLLLAFL
jgi:3-oxoadipate enol-lactonase